jgi:hypothetical protein
MAEWYKALVSGSRCAAKHDLLASDLTEVGGSDVGVAKLTFLAIIAQARATAILSLIENAMWSLEINMKRMSRIYIVVFRLH